MSDKIRKGKVIDRREHPREFFIAGWDPYIVSLIDQESEDELSEDSPGSTPASTPRSRRAALLAGTED